MPDSTGLAFFLQKKQYNKPELQCNFRSNYESNQKTNSNEKDINADNGSIVFNSFAFCRS